MIDLHLGCSEAWSMYLRLMVLLVLVGLATFGRQVSSDFQSTSSSTTPSVESQICHANGYETCSTSTESSSSSSPFSSSSSFSVERMLMELEMTQQNLRLNAMVEELKTFADRFYRLTPFPEAFKEYHLYGRVSALEGSRCGPDAVQCGARSRAQCVSDLFVCDGIIDCINGRDEDPHICSEEPVKIGYTYVGFSFWTSCLVRPPHRSMIVLLHSHRIPHFKSRVWLKALLIHHVDKDIVHIPVTGYFNFARRQMVLLPVQTTGEDLGVQCLFNRGDNIHLDCKIVRPGSFRQCGFASLARL